MDGLRITLWLILRGYEPIDQIAIGIGTDPDRTLLVAKIGAFELALSIPNNGLSGFSDDLAQILKTLSASRDQKN